MAFSVMLMAPEFDTPEIIRMKVFYYMVFCGSVNLQLGPEVYMQGTVVMICKSNLSRHRPVLIRFFLAPSCIDVHLCSVMFLSFPFPI